MSVLQTYDLDVLLQLCRLKDNRAQSQLYKAYKESLFIYARANYTTDNISDIEEVLNIAFARIFDKIHQFTGIGSFEGWMKGVLRYCIYDHYNKKQKHLKESGDFFIWDEEDPYGYNDNQKTTCFISNDDVLGAFCEKDYIEAIKNNLTPREYQIFMLYYEGYQHKEIGDLLKISEGTSKWHVSVAREKLRKIIKR